MVDFQILGNYHIFPCFVNPLPSIVLVQISTYVLNVNLFLVDILIFKKISNNIMNIILLY